MKTVKLKKMCATKIQYNTQWIKFGKNCTFTTVLTQRYELTSV